MTENQFEVNQTVRYEGYQDTYQLYSIPAFIGRIVKITKYDQGHASYGVLRLKPIDWNHDDPQAEEYFRRIEGNFDCSSGTKGVLAVSASKCTPYKTPSAFIPDQYGDY